MGTETQLVKIEHLYKEFDENTKVLSDINLTINKNEVIAIFGTFWYRKIDVTQMSELFDCTDKRKDYDW